MNKKKSLQKKIIKSLEKRAKGYELQEVLEEYVLDDNELKLTKRKISTKQVPPDTMAIKVLLELDNLQTDDDLAFYTDEQLLKEKEKLLSYLKEQEKLNEKE